LILRGAVDVRPEERRAVLLGFGYFFALLASYYLLRPIREEMGIRGGVQALRRVGDYALQRPARDILFTVVPREEKYKSGFIDTVVYRGGDALAVALWLARRERRMEAP
jgi:ATP/ADP translocase